MWVYTPLHIHLRENKVGENAEEYYFESGIHWVPKELQLIILPEKKWACTVFLQIDWSLGYQL